VAEQINTDLGQKPDNVIIKELYGTIYTIQEYFVGKKTLDEIIAQRILINTQNVIDNPSISNPLNG